ncbi:MAG: sigma 54-interacting transcriptional regulator, partial [Candidatus Aerophobetes bacterium]|nr:sigma 54-interacting transcriptional regulator [Candidatus Aerophobetes bacterium]
GLLDSIIYQEAITMKIGLIAPYPTLARLGTKLQRHYPIEVKEGDLKEGAKKAINLQKEGVKAIVSRGGTALLIKSSPHIYIPVIEIKVTGYDLLEALAKAGSLRDKTAIIGFSNVITGGRKIAESINLDIQYFEIKNETEVNTCLQKVSALGITNIVGDHIVVEKARAFKMNTILIESGEEAVIGALREAENTIEAVEKEARKTERYKTILDSIHDGIIVIDEDKKITVLNKKAENLLRVKENLVQGKHLNFILKDLDVEKVWKTGGKHTGYVWKNKGRELVLNIFPIKVEEKVLGAVVNATPLKVLQDTEIKVRKNLYRNGLLARKNFTCITQKSEVMREVVIRAQKYARTNLTILITGETGAGKDIFAQSVHNYSPFSDNPFVAINCATLPESLLETELFGYEEGTFTGAKKGGKPGLFELAHKGTIFLDEIVEMPLSLQNRLLRVIEEKRIRRVGGTKFIPIEVRIIAATNKDLKKLVEEGKFRKDLYYRVNVLHLNIPSLRDRKRDIIPIFEETISSLCGDNLHRIDFGKIRSEIGDILLNHSWPGNIRELINFAQRLFFISDGFDCGKSKLREIAKSELGEKHKLMEEDNGIRRLSNETLEEIEEDILRRYAMKRRKLGKNMSEIAKELGISRTTLWKKLKNVEV